jgi:hypothetical protein
MRGPPFVEKRSVADSQFRNCRLLTLSFAKRHDQGLICNNKWNEKTPSAFGDRPLGESVFGGRNLARAKAFNKHAAQMMCASL